MRAIAVALACAVAASPAAAEDRLNYEAIPHAPVTTGIGMLVALDLVARHELAPESCNFCGGNAFDRGITQALAWDDHGLAGTFSDIGLVTLPVSAIALGFAEDGRDEGLINALVFLEAFGVNFVTTEALKFAVARERPLRVYLAEDDPKVREKPEDWYVSFPSGHASTAFVSVAAAATIADLRGRDPAPIWLVGLPVAAGVAYFRVAAYYHWTTDVIAGAALGTIIGVAVPRLLHGPGGLGAKDERSEPVPYAEPVNVFQFGGAW